MPTAHEIAQKAADIRAELDRAYFETFTSDLGRLVLDDMKQKAYVTRGMLKDMASPVDPLHLAARAAVHAFVLDILERIERVRFQATRYEAFNAETMLSEPAP